MRNSRPVVYRDIQMRSMLEATWAAFFDVCQIRWEYEPAIFEGPGWLPDFLLPEFNFLVECKPIRNDADWEGRRDVHYACERVTEPGQLILLLGISPWKHKQPDGTLLPVIGRATMPQMVKHPTNWSFQALILDLGTIALLDYDAQTIVSKKPDFQFSEEQYAETMNNGVLLLEHGWAAAKNAVQWQPPKDGP
jgi:hypothetical protein